MKTALLKAVLTLSLLAAPTVEARLVTLIVNSRPEYGPTVTSNQVEIAANERAVLVNHYGSSYGLRYAINGLNNRPFNLINEGNFTGPPTIAGPARIILTTVSAPPEYGFCTLEITAESFPPDKTIVIPQGQGANIGLECSTNLIDWAPASLGVYTNQPANKFFRLRAERLP